MGSWTEQVNVSPIVFDGDTIIVGMKRMLVEDMLLLSANFDKEKGVLRFDTPLEVCSIASKFLPKYIMSISGMKKADGTDMMLDEFLNVINQFYFVPLVGEIFARLIQISSVSKAEEKN